MSAWRSTGSMLSVDPAAVADLIEPLGHELAVTVALEVGQARDLITFGGGVDAHDVGHLHVVLDELVDADDDVLLEPVALVVAERRLLDL